MTLQDATTDKQVFRVLAAKVASGELSTADAQLVGERYGINFAEFDALPDVCTTCGTTQSQWWKETKTQLLCSKCAV